MSRSSDGKPVNASDPVGSPHGEGMLDGLLGELRGLRRFARGLLFDRAGADDVVQDAWLVAIRRKAPDDASPDGWLRGIIRNVARQERRSDARRTRREHEASVPEAVCDSTTDAASRIEVVRLLMDALESLPDPQRTIVSMRYLDGLPPRAIAKRLLLPVNTVRTHVQRGLERMRSRLDDDGEGRARMLSVLAPLAGPPPWFITPPLESTLTSGSLKSGALAMSGKWLATAVVVVIALFASFLWRMSDPAVSQTDSGGPVATASVPPALGVESDAQSVEEETSVVSPVRTTPDVNEVSVRLSGRVVDESMRPIQGVPLRMTARPINDGEKELLVAGHSDRNGAFELSTVGTSSAWSSKVQVVGPDWFGYDEHQVILAGQDTKEVVVVAYPQDATVSGKVVDGKGAPIPSATVSGPGQQASCDDDGIFTLRVPSSMSSLTLWARADAYADRRQNLNPPSAGASASVQFQLVPELRVTGRVLDQNGEPIAGAEVKSTFGKAVEADSEGRYEIGSLDPSPGSVHLTAKAPGWIESFQQITILEPGRRWVVEGDPRLLIVNANELEPGTPLERDFRLDRGYSAVGVVLDPSGKRLVGASVWSVSPFGTPASTAVTGSDGQYRLDTLPTGNQTIRARHPRFADAGVQLAVTAEDHDLEAPPIHLTEGLVVAGRIATDDGTPIPSARISIEEGENLLWRGVAEADGHFRAENLPAGSLRVGAGLRGWMRGEAVVEAGRTDVVIRMSRASGLSGRVVDAATGDPVSMFEVTLFIPMMRSPEDPYARVWSTWTNGKHFDSAGGTFDTGGMALPPSHFIGVEVKAKGYAPYRNERVPIPDVMGQPELLIALSGGAVVRGTVFHENSGAAVAGATVHMLRHSDLSSVGDPAKTDDRGYFRMSAPPGERVRLRIQRPGLREITDGPFEVPLDGGSVVRRIEIGGASLTVTVVDPKGNPLPGLGVSLKGDSGNREERTGNEGTVRFTELKPGSTPVAVFEGERHDRTMRLMKSVMLASGQETQRTFSLGGGLTLRGELRGLPENTVKGSGMVMVTAIQMDADGQPDTGVRAGTALGDPYSIDGLSVGSWEVTAVFRDQETNATWMGKVTVELGDSDATADIELSKMEAR